MPTSPVVTPPVPQKPVVTPPVPQKPVVTPEANSLALNTLARGRGYAPTVSAPPRTQLSPSPLTAGPQLTNSQAVAALTTPQNASSSRAPSVHPPPRPAPPPKPERPPGHEYAHWGASQLTPAERVRSEAAQKRQIDLRRAGDLYKDEKFIGPNGTIRPEKFPSGEELASLETAFPYEGGFDKNLREGYNAVVLQNKAPTQAQAAALQLEFTRRRPGYNPEALTAGAVPPGMPDLSSQASGNIIGDGMRGPSPEETAAVMGQEVAETASAAGLDSSLLTGTDVGPAPPGTRESGTDIMTGDLPDELPPQPVPRGTLGLAEQAELDQRMDDATSLALSEDAAPEERTAAANQVIEQRAADAIGERDPELQAKVEGSMAGAPPKSVTDMHTGGSNDPGIIERVMNWFTSEDVAPWQKALAAIGVPLALVGVYKTLTGGGDKEGGGGMGPLLGLIGAGGALAGIFGPMLFGSDASTEEDPNAFMWPEDMNEIASDDPNAAAPTPTDPNAAAPTPTDPNAAAPVAPFTPLPEDQLQTANDQLDQALAGYGVPDSLMNTLSPTHSRVEKRLGTGIQKDTIQTYKDYLSQLSAVGSAMKDPNADYSAMADYLAQAAPTPAEFARIDSALQRIVDNPRTRNALAEGLGLPQNEGTRQRVAQLLSEFRDRAPEPQTIAQN